MDARVEIYKELGNSKPDFIIGNYRRAVLYLLHVLMHALAECWQPAYCGAAAKCGGELQHDANRSWLH